MNKIVLALALLAGISVFSFADANFDNYTNEMSGMMTGVSSNISTEMAKHMGFYTGDGNIYPVNTSGFLGLKFGIGVGVNTTPLFWKLLTDTNAASSLMSSTSSNAGMFSKVAQAFGLFPLPYDNLFLKIGLPVLPMDVGIRLGFVPTLNLDLGSGFNLAVGQFHFGAEARYVLFELPAGLIRLDARVSYDYDGGSLAITNTSTSVAYVSGVNVGTNTGKIGMSYIWSGNSIGAKVMAGLNIPVVGSIYAGVGMNMNLGSVKTTLATVGSYTGAVNATLTVSGLNETPYSAFDVRLIGGFNILFITAAVEYNIFSQDLAINLIPFSMAF